MIIDLLEKINDGVFLKALNLLTLKNFHFFIKNENLQYVMLSDSICEFLDINSEDLLYKKDNEVSWKNYSSSFLMDDVNVLITKKEHISEYILEKNNNTRFRVITHKVPILDKNDNTIGILGIATTEEL